MAGFDFSQLHLVREYSTVSPDCEFQQIQVKVWVIINIKKLLLAQEDSEFRYNFVIRNMGITASVTYIWYSLHTSQLCWEVLLYNISLFIFLYILLNKRMNIFRNKKRTISSTFFIRLRFQGYCCKSGIVIAWRVTLKYAYSPFKWINISYL